MYWKKNLKETPFSPLSGYCFSTTCWPDLPKTRQPFLNFSSLQSSLGLNADLDQLYLFLVIKNVKVESNSKFHVLDSLHLPDKRFQPIRACLRCIAHDRVITLRLQRRRGCSFPQNVLVKWHQNSPTLYPEHPPSYGLLPDPPKSLRTQPLELSAVIWIIRFARIITYRTLVLQ